MSDVGMPNSKTGQDCLSSSIYIMRRSNVALISFSFLPSRSKVSHLSCCPLFVASLICLFAVWGISVLLGCSHLLQSLLPWHLPFHFLK